MADEPEDGTAPPERVTTAEFAGPHEVAGMLRRAAERHRDVGRLLDRAAGLVLTDGVVDLLAELRDELEMLSGIDAGAARAVGRLIGP